MFLPVFSFLSFAKNVPNPLKNTDSFFLIDSLISNIKDSKTAVVVVFLAVAVVFFAAGAFYAQVAALVAAVAGDLAAGFAASGEWSWFVKPVRTAAWFAGFSIAMRCILCHQGRQGDGHATYGSPLLAWLLRKNAERGRHSEQGWDPLRQKRSWEPLNCDCLLPSSLWGAGHCPSFSHSVSKERAARHRWQNP